MRAGDQALQLGGNSCVFLSIWLGGNWCAFLDPLPCRRHLLVELNDFLPGVPNQRFPDYLPPVDHAVRERDGHLGFHRCVDKPDDRDQGVEPDAVSQETTPMSRHGDVTVTE